MAGIGVSFYVLKREKNLIYYVILMLSFFVPLFFAESYLFGFLVPFQWFMYYLTPSIAVFAAVSFVFLGDKLAAVYLKNRAGLRKRKLQVISVSLIVLLVFRSDLLYGAIAGNSAYYSTSDVKAYDAGVWLNQNYPDAATVVVSESPGSWFSSLSGKNVIAQTDPAVQRNEIAEAVLSLSDEIQTPQTLLRAYEAKGEITNEFYVSLDQVWYRVAFYSGDAEFVSFTENGTDYKFILSDLSRQMSFNQQIYPKQVTYTYYNEYVMLTQTILAQNDSYPINVSWSITPLKNDVSKASLYLTNYFDLQFNFTEAQIPQLMDWVNPWDVPSKNTDGTLWAVVTFNNSTLKDSYIGIYDNKKDVAFSFKFNDLPNWGNIGALGSHQIDAVRFRYDFSQINANQTVVRRYEVLTLSKNSFSTMQQNQLESLFAYNPGQFSVDSRDFTDYIAANDVKFIVYDKAHLDLNMLHVKFLQLIYSNNRYAVFKVLDDYNQTQT
jgi:hypothetical protein